MFQFIEYDVPFYGRNVLVFIPLLDDLPNAFRIGDQMLDTFHEKPFFVRVRFVVQDLWPVKNVEKGLVRYIINFPKHKDKFYASDYKER